MFRGIAYSVFATQAWGPEFDLQHSYFKKKKKKDQHSFSDPSTGEGETGGSWGLQTQGQWETLSPNYDAEQLKKTPGISLWPLNLSVAYKVMSGFRGTSSHCELGFM